MNIVLPEVKTFVRLYNPKDHKYSSCTLDSPKSDCLILEEE